MTRCFTDFRINCAQNRKSRRCGAPHRSRTQSKYQFIVQSTSPVQSPESSFYKDPSYIAGGHLLVSKGLNVANKDLAYPQTSIHTRVRNAVTLYSAGLAQARPNKTGETTKCITTGELCT